MGTHPRFKEWHGILVAVFIIGLVAGAHFWGNASAQSDSGGAGGAATVVNRPEDPLERDAIAVEGGEVDVSSGVTVGQNQPTGTPGTPSQPVPRFSAINTPVWVSTQGPAQIVDDLIVYGLTEVKGGLINNGAVGAPGGGGGGPAGPGPAPAPELTIAPAPAQPAGGNVLQSAVWDFPVASIQLSATGATVNVTAIKIAFAGTASPASFNALKLYDGASLVGDTITTFVDNKATVTGFTLPISANTQKTLVLHAFMGGSTAAANSNFRFGIVDPMDVTSSDASPTGTAMGNLFTVTAAPPSVSIAFDRASYTVESGGNAQAIVTLTAAAANQNVNAVETIPVTVSSNAESNGFALVETGANTGIFEKTIWLGLANTSPLVRDLLVNCAGDALRTQYPNVAPQTRAAATVATPPCLPDLIVVSPLTISPASPQAGNSVSFSGTVKNQGLANTETASQTRIRIDMNDDGSWDVPPLENFSTPVLNINATLPVSWNNAWTAIAGTHKVEVCADITRIVSEIDENNNCVLQTFTVASAPAPALAIGLAADNPPAQSVQAGTTAVTTTKFTLTAANGDVQVASIKITRSGTALDSDLLNVKLVDGATQISSVLSGGKFVFSGLNWTIANGASKTLSIKTDVKGSTAVGNTFSLSIAAASDVTATAVSSGATIVPSGSAAGNLFTVASPAQILTLTRQNIPAANSALTTGTNVTLLEFNAQMNTGSVNLKQLFIVPKTGKSGKITNLKLVNATTNATLDSVADSASVRGQDAYSFDISAAPQNIGTNATLLKVTGDVACGTANVEDHIIEAVDDVILSAPPAGLVKQGLPFATVSRTLTACPAPAAPTVTYKCSNNKLYADIAWSTLGKGDNTQPTAGFYIDLDNEAVTANAFRTGAGQNGFWNTASNYSAAETFSLASNNKVAPYSLGGFNENGGTAPGLLANLAFSTKYQTRIYYPKTAEHSLVKEFTTPSSCSGQTEFNLTNIVAPSTYGGKVEAGGFSFPSVLNSNETLFPYRPASEQSEPVTLFGSFIPKANASFIETANAQDNAPPLINPVYIFDDLYVYGNSSEPGNVFIKGEIMAAPDRDAINLGSNVLLTGNLTVAGDIQAANLTVSNGLTFNGGNLVVGSGNLSVNGNVTATTVGAFYRKEATSSTYSANDVSASIACEAGDILISCSGKAALPASSAYRYYGATANTTNCTASGGRLSSSNLSSIIINAQAVCFSPNGLPAGQTAVPTP